MLRQSISKYKLDEAFLQKVRPAIKGTWQQIGCDMPDPCPNSHAIEACIDADRLTFFNRGDRKQIGEEAAKALREAIDSRGYDTVFRKLCKEIKLS